MEIALVGVFGALLGILLTNAMTLVYDWRRRRERIRDVQTSLRAEIRSHRRWLESFDDEKTEGGAAAKVKGGEEFVPFVPREVATFVFDAIVDEINILPGAVIDPVILYYRQMKSLSAFAEDLRTERFERLERARKIEMYDDYLDMGVYALDLADDAIDSINRSLKAGSQD